MGKKNCHRNFQIRKYAFFNIWKINEQNDWLRNIQIRKYNFFNIWKSNEQKNCSRNFQIRKYAFFFKFEKAMSKKTVPEIFRLISMLFNVIINVIIF